MSFKNVFKTFVAAAVAAMAVGAPSCSDGEGDSLALTYYYSCSPDLLDFVVPTIHYVNEMGDSVSVTLSKDDFKTANLGEHEVTTFGKGLPSEGPKAFTAPQYPISLRYDGWEAKDLITVTYTPAPDAPDFDEGREYTFYHGFFSSKVEAIYKGKSSKTEEKKYPITEDVLSGADAQMYVNTVLGSEVTVTVDVTVEREER